MLENSAMLETKKNEDCFDIYLKYKNKTASMNSSEKIMCGCELVLETIKAISSKVTFNDEFNEEVGKIKVLLDLYEPCDKKKEDEINEYMVNFLEKYGSYLESKRIEAKGYTMNISIVGDSFYEVEVTEYSE